MTGAEVHSGFYEAYQNQRDKLHQILETEVFDPTHGACPDCNKIVCTGHSLGAALSLHCGADFGATYEGKIPVSVWNYGQPRVGNIEFAKYARSKLDELWRVIHTRDLVPHVPPIELGFYHPPTEVWNTADNSSYVVCDGSGEDPNCSDSQYYFTPADHLTYLGYFVKSEHC